MMPSRVSTLLRLFLFGGCLAAAALPLLGSETGSTPAGQAPTAAGPHSGAAAPHSVGSSVESKEPGTGLIDDSDSAWVWSGMVPYSDPKLHLGTGHAGGPGTYATYTFHGTAVDVVGLASRSITVDGQSHTIGKAAVIVDGKPVSSATMASDSVQYEAPMAHVTGLSDANHVVEVLAQDGWIVLDYIQATLTRSNSFDGVKYKGHSVIPEGDYVMAVRNAPDQFLDAPAVKEGTPLQIYTGGRGRLNYWHFTPVGPDSFRISPTKEPSQVLTILDGRCDNYPRVGLWHDIGDPRQRWTLVVKDSGYVALLSPTGENVALNVCGLGHTAGSGIIAYPHDHNEPKGSQGTNEQWYLVPAN